MLTSSVNVDWTEEQLNRVNQVVTEEARKARVAASFLPVFDAVDRFAVAVPNLQLVAQAVAGRQRLVVNSNPNLVLTTLSSLVYLPGGELADPDMTAALTKFRRTAGLIARAEDALIFGGQIGPGGPLPALGPLGGLIDVIGGALNEGLAPFNAYLAALPAAGLQAAPRGVAPGFAAPPSPLGSVVTAVTLLEAAGQFGPFACVLAPNFYTIACTAPAGTTVPKEQMLQVLKGGPVLQSGALPQNYGVVVAIGGSPIELVLASDISVQFLQLVAPPAANTGPRYVFQVSERIALRAKELAAIVVLTA